MLHVAALAVSTDFAIDRNSLGVHALDVTLLVPEPAASVVPEQPPASRPRGGQRPGGGTAPRAWQAPVASVATRDLAAATGPSLPRVGADGTVPAADLPPESSADGAAPVAAAVPAIRRDAPAARHAAYLHNPGPAYPMIARRNGEQGTVTLRVLVTRDGTPASVSVEQGSGSVQLDRSALAAVKGWRFVPAQERGEPVEAWMLVPIVFRLEGTS